uniref:Uncharacterized protein n=1 Tax=Sphaerodactylus townsendi TaxID=933632 RepID=A0ACB8EIM4_9SAUR
MEEFISNSSDNNVLMLLGRPLAVGRKQSHVQKSKKISSRCKITGVVRRDGTESEPEIDDLMHMLISVTSSVQQEERCASVKRDENITDPEDELIVNKLALRENEDGDSSLFRVPERWNHKQ